MIQSVQSSAIGKYRTSTPAPATLRDPASMPIRSPLCFYEGIVLPEWLDYNGHMNIACYVLAFDQATDAFVDYLGMDRAYRERRQCSTFVVETHINFQRELVDGDPIRITTQLLGFDSKRIHYFHRMYHAGKGALAATTELMLIHVSLGQRHSTPMALEVMDRLGAVMTEHMLLPHPPQAGRIIGVRAKKPSE
ncbi:MAG: thioesterase family protein [Candidatus Competibacteraceae bacterium]